MDTDLIARLRGLAEYIDDCDEAADALEAQARRIAELEEEVERYRQRWLSAESVIDVRHDRIAELEAALKDARDKALVEGSEIAFCLNGMPRSEIAQAFAQARAARAAYLGERE